MDCPHSRVLIELAHNFGYGLQVVQGLSRFSAEKGNWVFVRCPAKDLDRLTDKTFTGAIGHYAEASQLLALKRCKVPFCVSVSGRSDLGEWARVISDDYAVGRMAADYFLKKGYRKFGVSILRNVAFADRRKQGYVDRLREAGIDDVPVFHARSALPTQGDLPMALFVVSDSLALTLINRILTNGFQVPEDVAVLGVDDDEVVGMYAPVPISSIKLSLDQVGYAACELLESMVTSGKQVFETQILPPVGVVERRSTEVSSVSDERIKKVLGYMDEHLASIESIDTLSGILHMNRRTLERLFDKSMGMTPASWLMRRRVERAEKLLLKSDYNVDYVAELSGLVDRQRLYRSFKKLGRPLPVVLRSEKGR